MEKILKAFCQSLPGVGYREAPKKNERAQGGVERFHRTVQGLLQTYTSSLVEHYGLEKMDVSNELLSWLTRHAAWVHAHAQKHLGGETPHKVCTGHEYGGVLYERGETVFWMEPGGQGQKPRIRGQKDIGLGRSCDSDSHIIDSPTGIQEARTVKRLPEGQR